MPAVGLGTFDRNEGEVKAAVLAALKAGYKVKVALAGHAAKLGLLQRILCFDLRACVGSLQYCFYQCEKIAGLHCWRSLARQKPLKRCPLALG